MILATLTMLRTVGRIFVQSQPLCVKHQLDHMPLALPARFASMITFGSSISYHSHDPNMVNNTTHNKVSIVWAGPASMMQQSVPLIIHGVDFYGGMFK